MTERVRWTDDRIDDLIASWDSRTARLDARLNSMPDRLTAVEMNLRHIGDDSSECKEEVRAMRKDFTSSRQGLSRPEKIALLGSMGGFIGALAAALALLAGA